MTELKPGQQTLLVLTYLSKGDTFAQGNQPKLRTGRRGHNRRPGVVGREVITERHRNIALLVAGCYFMEMLDGTNIVVP